MSAAEEELLFQQLMNEIRRFEQQEGVNENAIVDCIAPAQSTKAEPEAEPYRCDTEAGRSNGGRSKAGRSNTGRSNTRRSNTQPGRSNEGRSRPRRSRPATVTKVSPQADEEYVPTKISKPATSESDGWIVRPMHDAPTVCWSDPDIGVQYSVQNPANKGSVLMKLHVHDGGLPKHASAIYLDRSSDTFKTLSRLMSQVESLWVDPSTGARKVPGVVRTVTPLPAWRIPYRRRPSQSSAAERATSSTPCL